MMHKDEGDLSMIVICLLISSDETNIFLAKICGEDSLKIQIWLLKKQMEFW